jgi:hypothetical protein
MNRCRQDADRLDSLVEANLLALPGVVRQQMFGATGYLVDHRLVAFRTGDSLACQPPADIRDGLLRSGAAREFEIRPGRGFGSWIALPLDSPTLTPDFLTAFRQMALYRPRRVPTRRAWRGVGRE